jgi:uncharacterized protein involved in exopolysaccharide biosynthesis
MELKEAARRILLQHRWLIACLVALGIAAGAYHGRHPAEYTASTRLVLGTDDPKSRTESGSIADTAKAIATSQTQVRRALEDANVDRNPNDVAKDHVSVTPLGTSGVVQLSVTDKDPDAAEAVANALAHRVIRVRTDVTNGQLEAVLADLTERLNDINTKISDADQKIDRLSLQAAQASPATANSIRAQRDETLRQRDFLAQQRSSLESERISVLSAGALRPKASVISAATVPTQTDSSVIVQDAVLGALLGLILGVGIAGLLETFRPTFVGSDSLAREFGTPLLGTIPTEGDEQRARQVLTRIALRVRLAAEGVQAHDVGLVPVGPDIELGLVAATVDELANGATLTEEPRRAASADFRRPVSAQIVRRLRVRPFGLMDGRSENGNTALVLVSPSVVKKDEVDEVTHLLRLTGSPLLGLVTYERPRERSRRFAFSAASR